MQSTHGSLPNLGSQGAVGNVPPSLVGSDGEAPRTTGRPYLVVPGNRRPLARVPATAGYALVSQIENMACCHRYPCHESSGGQLALEADRRPANSPSSVATPGFTRSESIAVGPSTATTAERCRWQK